MHTRTGIVALTVGGLLAAAMAVGASAGSPNSGPGNASDAPAGRYIIGYFDAPGLSRGATYGGAAVVDTLPGLNAVVVDAADARDLLRQAERDPRVRFVEWDDPAYAFLDFTPNDAAYADAGHWGSKRIGAEAAWDVTTGSTAVKVAMVDSGLNKAHEEYAGSPRVLQGYDFAEDDNDPEDSEHCGFHGTHTTGTAGATIDNGKGIAGMSQHTILPVKIFHGKNGGPFGCATSITAIVDAIRFTGDEGAHISSNSWGGGSSSTAINDAIAYAHAKGVVHVAAAGNSGPCTNCVSQPWKDNPGRTIIVSALDKNDAFASFSSEGPEVDVIAPGVDILSTVGGSSGYDHYSGTSMATPHVAGALALHVAATGATAFADLEGAVATTAEDLGLSAARQGAGLVRADGLVGTNAPPTASFTVTCTDLACDFDASASSDLDGTITSYAWDFGDGTTGTGVTVSHTFAEAGTFTVTLTVTDDANATDTEAQAVAVGDTSTGGGDSGTLHVHDIDSWRKGRSPYFQIRIHDDAETAVSGATVTVEVCKEGGPCATGSGDTGDDGSVTFRWQNAGPGTYTTCVTGVSHATLTYDSTQDHASSGSCHTETV